MAEKVKKKALFISLKGWSSQKSVKEPDSPVPNFSSGFRTSKSTSTNAAVTRPRNSIPSQLSPVVTVTRPSNSTPPPLTPKEFSANGIKDLIQCPLCLEVLHNPKMLPCQHTFCYACLTVYASDTPIVDCPTCRTRIHVTSPSFIDQLPCNLYIDSLLNLVKNQNLDHEHVETRPSKDSVPSTPAEGMQSVAIFAGGVGCSQCKTLCDSSDITNCQHCKRKFCGVCWSQHLDDMQSQVVSIMKQLDTAAKRLDHKIENFKDRCEHLINQINLAADEKISTIIESKEKLLAEAAQLNRSGEMTALALVTSLNEAKSVAAKTILPDLSTKDEDKVSTFINLHQNALQILSDLTKWDIERFVFDKDNFRIELDAATPLEAESDEPLPAAAKLNNPLESEDSLVLHYRARNFVPHYVWRKTSRPGGVAISPWDNHLYICGMDTHGVLVVERTQAKIVARLSNEDMLCPIHIAFMKSTGEIYVTDKWKHCVHVFSKDGEYLKALGQKGSRVGMFRSPEGIAVDNAQNLIYVVDTGNDRVQVLQRDGKFVDQIGVVTKSQVSILSSGWQPREVTCTELNSPTGIAVTNDRVIILDSGNRRVKVYNKKDKNKILEFGSLGQRKGQFRQPEVLTVDQMGFILVGDSGNCRVQVFKPNGQLVRVFGGFGTEPGKFGWISGIHVTKQLDIIISDTKNHSVNFI